MTATPPTAQTVSYSVMLKHGNTLGSERIICNNQISTTGNQPLIINQDLAAGATNVAVNLANFIDTANFITLTDKGNQGFTVSTASGGASFQVAPGGSFSYQNGNATPPTLYLNNSSGTTKNYVEIGVVGSIA